MKTALSRTGFSTLLAMACVLVSVSGSTTWARELVVDLSERVVAITTDFTGTEVLLFGTTPGEGDVVVVVRGPQGDQIVRRKERLAGVWVNADEAVLTSVPDYYAIAANKPLADFLKPEAQTLYEIGTQNLQFDLQTDDALNEADKLDFRRAFIRAKERKGLYRPGLGNVTFISERLFRTDIQFPANIMVGTYGIDVYLIKDGEVMDVETTLLGVRKFGVEASAFEFAHRHSFAYGVLAVFIAVVAGWLASLAFRKG